MPDSIARRPSKSVARPPASSMRTVGAAASHDDSPTSIIALRRALGEQRIAPEVAETALPPDVAEQVVEARREAGRDDVPPRPVQDLRVGEVG